MPSKWVVFCAHRGKRGKKTKELARDLARKLGVEPKSNLPIPKLGDSKLAQVDIAIAKNSEVKVLCEIEESSYKPKTIIGDIVNVMFSENKIQIGPKKDPKNIYRYHGPHLVVGLLDKQKRRSEELKEKIENRVKPVRKGFDFKIVYGKEPGEIKSRVEKHILDFLSL